MIFISNQKAAKYGTLSFTCKELDRLESLVSVLLHPSCSFSPWLFIASPTLGRSLMHLAGFRNFPGFVSCLPSKSTGPLSVRGYFSLEEIAIQHWHRQVGRQADRYIHAYKHTLLKVVLLLFTCLESVGRVAQH